MAEILLQLAWPEPSSTEFDCNAISHLSQSWAKAQPVETLAPFVEVPNRGQFVLSTDEIFAIDTARLKHSVGVLSIADRAKIKPALDKVIGEY